MNLSKMGIFRWRKYVSGLTLISNNYDGEIQDITIFSVREKQMGGPLTH